MEDAGGAAAGGANGLGVDADVLADLADDHHLCGVVDEVDAGDLADCGGGLHVDDALATAGLGAIGSCREMHSIPTVAKIARVLSERLGLLTPPPYVVPTSPYGVPDLILWGTNLTLCVNPHLRWVR